VEHTAEHPLAAQLTESPAAALPTFPQLCHAVEHCVALNCITGTPLGSQL